MSYDPLKGLHLHTHRIAQIKELEDRLDSIEAALLTFLLLDGSKPMTGELDMGSNRIINMSTCKPATPKTGAIGEAAEEFQSLYLQGFAVVAGKITQPLLPAINNSYDIGGYLAGLAWRDGVFGHWVYADTLKEYNPNAGVTADGVLHKDGNVDLGTGADRLIQGPNSSIWFRDSDGIVFIRNRDNTGYRSLKCGGLYPSTIVAYNTTQNFDTRYLNTSKWVFRAYSGGVVDSWYYDDTGIVLYAAKSVDCAANGGYLKPRRLSQAAQPTPDSGELLVWRDTDDDSVRLVYNDPDVGVKTALMN